MPKMNYENVGEVLKHEFLRGIIKTVDSETDTCTVEVSGRTVDALLFYHCEPESVIRDNGAITGAAAGFAKDDAVIVQTNRDDPTEYLVVAHLDGARHCNSMSLYFYSTSADSWCFIWDAGSNDYKKNVPLNRASNDDPIVYASFPCKRETITDWLATQSDPDTYGDIFHLVKNGSTAYVPLSLDLSINDSNSASAAANVGGGINTAVGVSSVSGTFSDTPGVGEEWHNAADATIDYNTTDAYGQHGALALWPLAWSAQYAIDAHFVDGGNPMTLLTSEKRSWIKSTINDGFRSYTNHADDWSSSIQTEDIAIILKWSSPFVGILFECPLLNTYSFASSSEGEAPATQAVSGQREYIPARSTYIADPLYLQYANYLGITSGYTKTLMAYVFIALFKVIHVDYAGVTQQTVAWSETIHRKVFAGFKTCNDTSEESPLSITRKTDFENAIIDVLTRQAAEIDMTEVPESAGEQIADRAWNFKILGGKDG